MNVRDVLLKRALMTDFEGDGFEYAHLGIRGPIKFEIHRLSAHPKEMDLVSRLLGEQMIGNVSSIAGVPTGGEPFAFLVSSYFEIPAFRIKGNYIEDGYVVGNCPGLIEDATNTGKSGDIARGVVKGNFNVDSKIYSIFNYGFRDDVPSLVYFRDILPCFKSSERERLEERYEKAKKRYNKRSLKGL